MLEESSEPRGHHLGGDQLPMGVLLPKDDYFLSPEGGRTPPRTMSSHSLIGEDIMLSSRLPIVEPLLDTELSPFSPGENGTVTPPSLAPETTTLSPPPLIPHRIEDHSTPEVSPEIPTFAQEDAGVTAPHRGVVVSQFSRPPRAPHGHLPIPPSTTRRQQHATSNGQETPTGHRRGHSNTDASLMSALTDDLSINANSVATNSSFLPRRRTMSWDVNDSGACDSKVVTHSPAGRSVPTLSQRSTHTPDSLLQPIFGQDEGDDAVPPQSITMSSWEEDLENKGKALTNSKKLRMSTTLSDEEILNGTMDSRQEEPPTGLTKRASEQTPPSVPLHLTMPDAIKSTEIKSAKEKPLTRKRGDAKGGTSENTPLGTSENTPLLFPTLSNSFDVFFDEGNDMDITRGRSGINVTSNACHRGMESQQELQACRQRIPKDSEKAQQQHGPDGETGKSLGTRALSHVDVNQELRIYMRGLCRTSSLVAVFVCFLGHLGSLGGTRGKDTSSVLLTVALAFCHAMLIEAAKILQWGLVDILTIQTKATQRILGPYVALFLAQSRGWPFVAVAWASMQISLDKMFAIKMYEHIQLHVLGLGLAATLKRVAAKFLSSKGLVDHYQEDLIVVKRKLGILSQVAILTEAMKASATQGLGNTDTDGRMEDTGQPFVVDGHHTGRINDSFEYSEGPGSTDIPQGTTSGINMMEVLDQWDEPVSSLADTKKVVNIHEILMFRRALRSTEGEFAFSEAFGSIASRERCFQSSQVIYDILASESCVPFTLETLASVVAKRSGRDSHEVYEDLSQVFPGPDSGRLSKLDFVKCIDRIYKTLRSLQASIKNSSRIHSEFEDIVDYVVAIWVSLIMLAVILGPAAVFPFLLSACGTTTLLVATNGSHFIQGLFLVLVHKQYDIGDRIVLDMAGCQHDNVNVENSWVVQGIDLHTTTLRRGSTREMASISNGSMAKMQITNLKRSEHPVILVNLKVPVIADSDRVELFRQQMMSYVRRRPREWKRFVAFRAAGAELDLGYVQYELALEHQDSWQYPDSVLASKSAVIQKAVSIQKELELVVTGKE